MPTHTIADTISRNILANVVGRDEELAALAAAAQDEVPLVSFVCGVSGIGKTTLLRALGARFAVQGIRVVTLDGSDVEPTAHGILAALAQCLADPQATLDSVGTALEAVGRRVVLIIDAYDALGLVDTWLRQTLIPALPDNVRLVIGTKLPPGPQWTGAVEWRGLVGVLHLHPLDEVSAHHLLARLNVPRADAERIVAMAGGLPVALTLAGDASNAVNPLPNARATPEQVLAELARRFLDGIDDPAVCQAVQAASVVRRLTETLLKALVPDGAPDLLFNRLRSLAFCSMENDGLRLHDAVRDAIATDLHAADPERYRHYRQVAWRLLDNAMRDAGRGDLWRYMADLIYLISNPIWRDAFFPPGAPTLFVEPARPDHASAIRALAREHEPVAAAALVDLWLAQAFHAFHVVVDSAGDVVGFYCLCDAARVPAPVASEDPVTASWLAHLAAQPLAAHESALFLRRWLSAGAGEAPSPPQAASWLDIKRAYLERRPSLRRVYLALEDLSPYGEVAATLGFEPLGAQPVTVGEARFQSALLDMGPKFVSGWLSRLVAAELGVTADGVLDHSRRGLCLGERFVPLTPREFDVMAYLDAREGTVVARENLLNDVWGWHFDGGSNVVDAVVLSVRRKLGTHAGMIETVRGHGYLWRGSSGQA